MSNVPSCELSYIEIQYEIKGLFNKLKRRFTLRTFSEKLVYYLITFIIFVLLFKIVAWLENTYISLNTQTQLISGIILIPAIVILSFVLSSLLFNSLKESK